MAIPATKAKRPSIVLAKLSALTPLIICVSLAMLAEITPGAFFLSSNHPICFLRIELYKSYLTLIVTFSPITPKVNFYANPVTRAVEARAKISPQYKLEYVLMSLPGE